MSFSLLLFLLVVDVDIVKVKKPDVLLNQGQQGHRQDIVEQQCRESSMLDKDELTAPSNNGLTEHPPSPSCNAT